MQSSKYNELNNLYGQKIIRITGIKTPSTAEYTEYKLTDLGITDIYDNVCAVIGAQLLNNINGGWYQCSIGIGASLSNILVYLINTRLRIQINENEISNFGNSYACVLIMYKSKE